MGSLASVAQEITSAAATAASRFSTGRAGKALIDEARRETLGAVRPAIPHRDVIVGPHAGVRPNEMRGERAGADDEEALGVSAHKEACGKRRSRSGAPVRQPRPVERRQGLACPAGLKNVDARDRRQPARAVAGKDVDDLHAEIEAGARGALGPGGHEEVGRDRLARALHRMMMAVRRDETAAHRLRKLIDEAREIERPVDIVGRESAHQPRFDRDGVDFKRASGAGKHGCAALSVCASARRRSASARFWRAARRWRPCETQVAAAPATTPSIAATIAMAKSGASMAKAALSGALEGVERHRHPLPVGEGEEDEDQGDDRDDERAEGSGS